MEPGDTFLIDDPAVHGWLWVVICRDDVEDTELIAGIVPSRHKSFDPACEIGAMEHESLFQNSFVNYAQAKILTPPQRASVADFFLPQGQVSDRLLRRIQKGCIDSDHAYSKHKRIVLQLVPGIELS